MICCQIIVKTIADKYEINVDDVKKIISNLVNKTVCSSLQKSSGCIYF